MKQVNKKWFQNALLLLIIGAVVFAAYAKTISSVLVWDDHFYVKKFSLIFNSLSSIFINIDHKIFSDLFYRPVAALSYLFDYSIWHENAKGYHLTNFLLQILNSVLLFALCIRANASVVVAFCAAMLFALHPIHTESVSLISGRFDLISTAFVLLAMICHMEHGRGDKKAVIPAVLFFGFALFSKETALAVLIIFALYDLLIAKKKIMLMPYICYGLVAIIYVVMRYTYLSDSSVNISLKSFPDILLLFFSATGFYFYKFIFPFNLSIYIADIPNIPLFFILGTVVFIITGFLYVKGKRIAAFLMASFIITLMPSVEGSFTTMLSPPFAERYLYLPSAFLCAAASMGAVKLKPFGKYVLAAVLIIFGIATFQRNDVWKSEAGLWKDAMQKTEHWYPQAQYARILSSEGKRDDALNLLQGVLEKASAKKASSTALSGIYNSIGQINYVNGDFALALEYFKKSISLNANNFMSYYNLGNIYFSMARESEVASRPYLENAEENFLKAIDKNAYSFESYIGLGKVYFEMGDYARSLKYYEKVLEKAPRTVYSAEAVGALLRPQLLKVK